MSERIFLGYPPDTIKNFINKNYSPQINTTPLTFTSLEASDALVQFTITKTGNPNPISLEYRVVEDDDYFTDFDNENLTVKLKGGKTVIVRAVNQNTSFSTDANNYYSIKMIGSHKVSGNIMSLLDPTCQVTSVPAYCFYYLFKSCTGMIEAPELPATTLANNCYGWMFYGCTNLSNINVSFSAWDPSNATTNWVRNVASSGTFTCPTALPETKGVNYIPTGWTVVRK